MLDTIYLVVAIIVGLMTILKPVRRWIAKGWNKVIGRDLLNKILSELKPNGGTSLRDAVDNIARRQNDVEAFLTAQLNIIDVPVFRADSDGNWIYANRAFKRLINAGGSEVVGDGWINFINPENRDEIMRKWKEAVNGHREFSERVPFNHGTMHINAYMELDSLGRLRGYIGVLLPIN